MVGSLFRFAAAALFATALAGCATSSDIRVSDYPASGARIEQPDTPKQCVAYARTRSGLQLHGDANTWWAKAEGRYARGSTPRLGAVIVLTGYARDGRNHLGVVSSLISDREIRIDHANWFDDGNIYLDNPVLDVSSGNDWSAVRVWNAHTGAWGGRIYQVQGFIGPDPAPETEQLALY